MHEYLTSRFLEGFLKSGAEAKRGADVDPAFRADADMRWNDKLFYVELDRVTEPLWRVKKRLQVYDRLGDAVLFVTLNQQRIQAVKRECDFLSQVLLLTTVEKARAGVETWFEDVFGTETQI